MMPLIDDAKLAMMRAHTAMHRPTPCQVLRNTPAPDGWSGSTESWAVISDPSLTCRVSPWRPGREVVAEEELQAQDYWEIALPWDTDVAAKDHIAALGLTYEVSAIGPETFKIELSVQCARLVDVE